MMTSSAIPYIASVRAQSRAAWGGELRFTLDGDHALERHLAQVCQRVLSGVRGLIPPQNLEALLLGGGYGRGEGGVLRDVIGDSPYNDIEFYVAIRGQRHLNELRYGRALEVLGEILTQLAGVEVEFKITSIAELRAMPISMFSYDLFAGNRLLWGDPHRLDGCGHHLMVEQLPLSEATRLLMNRGTGLLLAQEKLSAEELAPGDADFVRRNIAKAALACGDAVLVASGRYHWSCRERHRRLECLAGIEPTAWHEDLLSHHVDGVNFKLRPHATTLSRGALTVLHADVTDLVRHCWLWIEQKRLGVEFPSARAYARSPVDKCPGSPRMRNLLLNLRVGGFRPHGQPAPWRHPRQRIYHALALLLWDRSAVKDPATLAQLQRELCTSGRTFPELVRAYQAVWTRVR